MAIRGVYYKTIYTSPSIGSICSVFSNSNTKIMYFTKLLILTSGSHCTFFIMRTHAPRDGSRNLEVTLLPQAWATEEIFVVWGGGKIGDMGALSTMLQVSPPEYKPEPEPAGGGQDYQQSYL